jgi:hypothetical protein
VLETNYAQVSWREKHTDAAMVEIVKKAKYHKNHHSCDPCVMQCPHCGNLPFVSSEPTPVFCKVVNLPARLDDAAVWNAFPHGALQGAEKGAE